MVADSAFGVSDAVGVAEGLHQAVSLKFVALMRPDSANVQSAGGRKA
jgi:hypothetical protein